MVAKRNACCDGVQGAGVLRAPASVRNGQRASVLHQLRGQQAQPIHPLFGQPARREGGFLGKPPVQPCTTGRFQGQRLGFTERQDRVFTHPEAPLSLRRGRAGPETARSAPSDPSAGRNGLPRRTPACSARYQSAASRLPKDLSEFPQGGGPAFGSPRRTMKRCSGWASRKPAKG